MSGSLPVRISDTTPPISAAAASARRADWAAAILAAGFVASAVTFYVRSRYGDAETDAALLDGGLTGAFLVTGLAAVAALTAFCLVQVRGSGTARALWVVLCLLLSPSWVQALMGDRFLLLSLIGLCLWLRAAEPERDRLSALRLAGLAVAVTGQPLLALLAIRRIRRRQDCLPGLAAGLGLLLAWNIGRMSSGGAPWFGADPLLDQRNASLMTLLEGALRLTQSDRREIWVYTLTIGFGVWTLWQCWSRRLTGFRRDLVVIAVPLLVLPGVESSALAILLAPLAVGLHPAAGQTRRMTTTVVLLAAALAWKEVPVGPGFTLAAFLTPLLLAGATAVAVSTPGFWREWAALALFIRGRLHDFRRDWIASTPPGVFAGALGAASAAAILFLALARMDADWVFGDRVRLPATSSLRWLLTAVSLTVHVLTMRWLLSRNRRRQAEAAHG